MSRRTGSRARPECDLTETDDLCVLDVTPSGFEVLELAAGSSRKEIVERTGTSLRFSDAATYLAIRFPTPASAFQEMP
jgi:acyl CoA:acetate/3-ketoacid CoA transferase beta subunit